MGNVKILTYGLGQLNDEYEIYGRLIILKIGKISEQSIGEDMYALIESTSWSIGF